MRSPRFWAHISVLISVLLALAACIDGANGADSDGADLSAISSELVATSTGPMISFEPAESSSDFVNPERGFYTGYDLRAASDAAPVRTAGYALAIAVVNLEGYRQKALDAALLTALRSGFARVRRAGIKLVLRFSYNAAKTADASKARILGHIGQLAPLLRENADVIAVMQAGFIGAWGEWHASTNGLDNPTARGEIIAALLAALPWNRFVQLRTPMFKDAYRAGAVTASDAYSGSSRSRLGHHNDCFLASANDYGTYDAPVSDWMSYVAADTLYTPMGGETCAVHTARTNCTTAVAELERLHWSYLNREYHPTVIKGFVDGGCDATIRQRLGYRFVLRRVAHSQKVAPGGVLALEVDIRNRGFAALYNQRPLEVVLASGSVRHVAQLSFDVRRLPAGLKTTVKAYLRVPANLAPGAYTLALRLPDASPSLAADPRYAIRLANSGVWDEATGDNVLTRSLAIDAAAPGKRDPSATSFVELR